jgi:Zn-dependent protease/CBS domain-containing protein
VTWSLAAGYFPDEYPQLSTAVHWILGLITSLLFFGSVLLHELGHAYLALRDKLKVHGITLFIFGGVAQIEKEPPTAASEFRIAIAGPIVSFALAAVFGLLFLVDQGIAWLAAPSIWLARINLILALFNLIPGFPLDGGRVLRAAVWYFTGNYRRANRVASITGQVAAFGFIAVGIIIVLTGSVFNGLWLVFIGWFLQNAAANAFAQSNMQEMLRTWRVGEIMTTDWPQVSSRMPLNQLVEDKVLRGGPRYYFVMRDGYGLENNGSLPYGMVSLSDVTAVPRPQWPLTPAEQVMIPWERLVVVEPEMTLLDALKVMDDANVAQVPVLHTGQLVGVLSREQVLHTIRLRSELQV